MAKISQLTDWVDLQVLTHTDLNAEFEQIINTVNALGNANWADAGVANLGGAKVDVNTNSTFLAEHTEAGVHSAIAGSNMDKLTVSRISIAKVGVTFNRINVYNSDVPTTRVRKLIQTTAPVVLNNIDIETVGVNGREAGSSEGASEWWYIWIIYKSSTSTAAGFLSPYSTIATITLPTDYDYAFLVGRVYNNAAQAFEKPEAVVGANVENFIVPFDAAHVYAVPGYHVFGSRGGSPADGAFMVQWGQDTVGAAAQLLITLPVAYTAFHMMAFAGRTDGAYAGDESNMWAASNHSLTQIRLFNGTAFNKVLNWFSFGY